MLPLPSVNVDLKDISTKFPSLNTGTVRMSITEVACEESENKPGTYPIKFKLQLEEPWHEFGNNKPLNVGFAMTKVLMHPGGKFSDTDKSTAAENQERAFKQICQFMDAAFKIEKQEDRPSDLNQILQDGSFIGKHLLVTFKEAQKKDWGDTEISAFKPIKD